MSKKAIVVLAIMVAALGAYVALFERGSLTSKELEERKGKVLTTFVRDKVMRLELTRKGQKVVLQRDRADDSWSPWTMLAPVKGEADQQAVDQLLGELEWLSARRIIDNVSSEDQAKFNLKEPSFEVRYRVSGDEHVLRVGSSDAHGDNHYASVDDESTAYIVPKTLVETLDHEVSHYRTKQFLGEITSGWAQRVELTLNGQKQLVQKEDGRWWYMGNPKGYADRKRVEQLVQALDAVRAVRYLEGSAKTAGLAALTNAHAVDLRVMPDQHREDKEPQRFLLRFAGPCAAHEGERYAQAGEKGDPVCVRADDLVAVEASERELRLSRLFDVDVSEIEQLELKAQGATLQLKRDGEKWQAQGVQAPDREAVEAWLAQLAREAGEVLPFAQLREDATLTLNLVSDKKLVVHAHFDQAAQQASVWRDGEGVLVRFPWSLALALSPFQQRFATLEPWSAKQPSQVTRIDVRDGALKRTLILSEGAWRTAKGGPAVADEARVRELVRQLIKLHALANVAGVSHPTFGLETPRAQLTLGTEAGQPLTLELGAATQRGSYARVAGVVVEVGEEVERALRELSGGHVDAPEAGADVNAQAAEPGLQLQHDHDHHDHE